MKLKMVILGAFIVGILISTYFKTLGNTKAYITLDEKKRIDLNIELNKKEIEQLKEKVKEYKLTLKEYEKNFNSDESVEELMVKELDYLKSSGGFSKVEGPGIVVTIKDSDKELEITQTPNDLIVHDIDILRVVNDLKKAGSSAISINGERLLSTSKIKCSGATITVNETTYGQPFIIKAVGNVETLMAAMISPQSYTNLLKDVYGIYIDVESKNKVIINPYEKN
ncbi:DUF881 domain-containing protein [Romboutsia maritimum]|uniref:DUF881 domain-containing protein n=1 Tax=Romboutsia maritimum TaxID=2020948 RepID=A0A371IX47_9FIRM|nr:DUF881 domain-containing protein [Romboutsia maritimum]